MLFAAVAALAFSDVPPAMLAFEAHRTQIRTGTVDYSYERHLVIQDKLRREDRFATLRLAGPDRIWVDRGDVEGVMFRDTEGNASPFITRPLHYLASDRLWRYEEQSDAANVSTPDHRNVVAPDLRTLGGWFTEVYDPLEGIGAAMSGPGVVWGEEPDGELVRVTRRRDESLTTWWIDPARGWGVVRSTLEVGGKLSQESRTRLREYTGGLWFPESVEYHTIDGTGALRPKLRITVDSAEFNAPDDPQRFTPADIGVTVGMAVRLESASGRELAHGRFDGKGYATFEEFSASGLQPVRRGGTATRPAEQRSLPLAEWERYTLDFTSRHKLRDDARQKALQVLRECQDRAREYTQRREGQFAELERALRRLTGAGDTVRAETVRKNMARLMLPVDAIFEKELKPRLEKLRPAK